MKKIVINGTKSSLSVNLYSIYNTTLDLNITTPNLIERLSELDLEVYSVFVFHCLNQNNECIEYDDILDLSLEEFIHLVEVTNKELSKAMPKGKEEDNNSSSNDNSEEDWDFSYLQYIWNTLLNRSTDFLKETPRNIMEQFDIYKKVNGLEETTEGGNKKSKVVEKYIDEISW